MLTKRLEIFMETGYTTVHECVGHFELYSAPKETGQKMRYVWGTYVTSHNDEIDCFSIVMH